MMVIARRKGERIVIRLPGQPAVTITVQSSGPSVTRLAIDAPQSVIVHRAEGTKHDAAIPRR